MKYIKSFKENKEYSIFNSNGWKKLLPYKLKITTDSGKWELKLPDDINNINPTNISNIMNAIQIDYHQNTLNNEDGDSTFDGEPSHLGIDICIIKDNDGTKGDSNDLKLDIDITYGDYIPYEFSIKKPNIVKIIHKEPKKDNNYFGFSDESLNDLISFFNSWGFSLTPNDFKFMDKSPNTNKNKGERLSTKFMNKFPIDIQNDVENMRDKMKIKTFKKF